jgi:hypothetical protein
MLPLEKVNNAIIKHSLHQIDDQELVLIVTHEFPKLTDSVIRYDHYNISKKLLNQLYANDSEASGIIHSLFYKLIDYAQLEEARINQILEMDEVYPKISKPKEVLQWLSGGTSFTYLGTDNKEHEFSIEYPYTLVSSKPNQISGAIYIDNNIVPIRSFFESELITDLKNSFTSPNCIEIQEVINFIQSVEYLNVAKKVGRIK